MVAKGRSALGEKNGARLHPESLARGEKNGARLHPDRLARGGRHGQAKFTDPEATEIRRVYATGRHSQRVLGLLFAVTHARIQQIVRGETYSHAGGPITLHGHDYSRLNDSSERISARAWAATMHVTSSRVSAA
jgi:hypothetical protein